MGVRKDIIDRITEKTASLSTHSHWAEDDARHMLIQWFLIQKVIDINACAEKEINDFLRDYKKMG